MQVVVLLFLSFVAFSLVLLLNIFAVQLCKIASTVLYFFKKFGLGGRFFIFISFELAQSCTTAQKL